MLTNQRNRIDQIDQELVKLFEERMAVVKEVIEVKLANNMEILDSGREEQVIQKAVGRLENKALSAETEAFFTDLMRVSREYQAKIRENAKK